MPATATKTSDSKTAGRYQLASPAGGFRVPTSVPQLPSLAPPRFDLADQQANPERPMTRVVKDVLSVGRWKVGYDAQGQTKFWQVDPETLSELAENFALATARGLQFKLYWGNCEATAGSQHNVVARDAIAPIDQLIVEGDRLWCACYVTPEQAAELANPAHQVSVGCVSRYQDGRGREYGKTLLHVAIVDTPIVDQQGPFLFLANESGGSAMDLARLLELINELLPDGVEVPSEGVTEETLIPTVELIINTVKGINGEPTEASTEESETVADSATVAEAMGDTEPAHNELSNTLKDLRSTLIGLSNEVKALKADKTNAAKEAFNGRLKGLFDSGNIDAATRTQWEALGPQVAYNLATLKPLEALTMVNSQRRGRKMLANNEAPSVGVIPSTEEINERREARGEKPVDPKKFRAAN